MKNWVKSSNHEISVWILSGFHDAGFVEFLQNAWDEWSQTGFEGEAIASCWPARRMSNRIPKFIEGKVGYYSMSSETSISKGTWEAADISKDVALTGAEYLLKRNQKGFFHFAVLRVIMLHLICLEDIVF